MAARVVGIRQEGESLPDGAVHEGRGTRAAAMTSRARCNVRELRLADASICFTFFVDGRMIKPDRRIILSALGDML